MNKVIKSNIFPKEIDEITTAYRGKPGCMCGCLGTYFRNEDPTIKRILNKMKKNGKEFVISKNWISTKIGTMFYCIYFN